MVTGFQAALQGLPTRAVQQVAAHGWQIQPSHLRVQIKRSIARGQSRTQLILTLGHCGIGKGPIDLGGTERQVRQQLGLLQARPIQRSEQIQFQMPHLIGVVALAIAQLGPGHFQRSRQQTLIQNPHRGGGFGNPIDINIGTARLGRAVLATADFDVLLQRQAFVLLHKGLQGQRAQTIQEHGFVLRQHPHIPKLPFAIEQHQQVDGRS